MKKYLVILLTLVLVFSFNVVSMAEVIDKPATATLTASDYDVETGEPVTFTVRTLKQGSNYANPTWYDNGNIKGETLDVDTTFVDDYYESTKTLTFDTPGDHQVTVKVVMSAGKGKSNVQFVTEQTVTIHVSAAKSILTSVNFYGSDNIFNNNGESLVLTFSNNIKVSGPVTVVYFDGIMEIQSAWLPFTVNDNTLTITANRILGVPRTNMTGHRVMSVTGLVDSFGNPVVIPAGGIAIQ